MSSCILTLWRASKNHLVLQHLRFLFRLLRRLPRSWIVSRLWGKVILQVHRIRRSSLPKELLLDQQSSCKLVPTTKFAFQEELEQVLRHRWFARNKTVSWSTANLKIIKAFRWICSGFHYLHPPSSEICEVWTWMLGSQGSRGLVNCGTTRRHSARLCLQWLERGR